MKVASFDIFDTLVTRSYHDPKDIFTYLESRYGLTGFAELRIQAESQARYLANSEEISFDDIYDQLQSLNGTFSLSLAQIQEIELQEELNSFGIIRQTLNRLRVARSQGSQIIYISDMYHSVNFIKKILLHLNVWSEGDRIYVSSEYAKTKHSGKLYQAVLSDLKCNPDSICHIGDNEHSDVLMANQSGIDSIHFVAGNPTRYEEAVHDHDFLVRTVYGISRQLRLGAEISKSDFHQTIYETSTSVLAPLVVSFVVWCIESALEQGLESIYFLSRDGQVLYLAACKIIASRYPGKIKAKYLYVSRQALLLPSLSRLDDEELEWILAPTSVLTLEIVFARISLDANEHIAGLAALGLRKDVCDQLTPEDLEIIRAYLIDIEDVIVSVAKTKRRVLLDYLEQEGLFESPTIGIVDVGWSGTLQRSLSRLLRDTSPSFSSSFGFYFGISRIKVEHPDVMMGWFFDTCQKPLLVQQHYIIPVIELFFAADHGGVVDYSYVSESDVGNSRSVRPNLRSLHNDKALQWGLRQQQSAVLDFTQHFLRRVDGLSINDLPQRLLPYVEHNLSEMYTSPSLQEARAYGGYLDAEDQNESYYLRLAKGYSWSNLIDFYKTGRKNHHNEWAQASLMLSGYLSEFAFKHHHRIADVPSKSTTDTVPCEQVKNCESQMSFDEVVLLREENQLLRLHVKELAEHLEFYLLQPESTPKSEQLLDTLRTHILVYRFIKAIARRMGRRLPTVLRVPLRHALLRDGG